MVFFRFEKRDPKPVEYRTLADVPEGCGASATLNNLLSY